MMSRYFRLILEPSGAIAKKLPHVKNQLSVPGTVGRQLSERVGTAGVRITEVVM